MAFGNSHSESKLALPQDMKGSRLPVRDIAATESMPLKNVIVHNTDKEGSSSREMSSSGSENHDASITNGKSKNPFKRLFGRSKSHHSNGFPRILAAASPSHAKHGLSERSMSEEDTKQRSPVAQGGGRPRGVSLNKNKQPSVLPSLALHNSNPFACGCRKPTVESPFSVLGTGTDVASPRNPLVASGLSTRNTSHNLGNSINTPTISAQSSRSISYYQAEGSDKSEKLLPLPVRSPNDQLPPPLRQPSILLTDNFSFPPDGERRIIGEGGSSQVVTIVSNYRRSNIYALKRFKMFAYEEPDDFYDRCIREYLIAKKLDGHINIIKTFYIMKVQSSATNGVRRSWAFIMQRCVQDMYYFSTLSGWTNKPLDEKWCCFKQIARGVRHMHTYGIAHRDVKLENVLATDYGALKLTDFGVSTYGIENPDDKDSPRINIKGYCGSPPHVPPEVMILSSDKRKKAPVPDDKAEYDPFAMDMWALGMVLYTLVIPALPFTEAHKEDPRYRQFLNFYEQFCRYNTSFKKSHVYKSGPGAEHPEFSRFQSTDATRVCLRLLDPDPSTRYTMEELFDDPWFHSIETCVDEGTDEPIKVPELRKTTEGSDSPYAHDISPCDEESITNGAHQHTSNPFIDKLPISHAVSNCSVLTSSNSLSRPISSSRPLLNIAEDSERSSQPLVPGSVELPTLNEEEPITPREHTPEEDASSPQLVPTKKISNLSLNEIVGTSHPLAPTHVIEQPSSPVGLSYGNNGHSLSRSSSVVSKNSVGTPLGGLNSSGSSVTSATRSKKKRAHHRHHECNGKPILIMR